MQKIKNIFLKNSCFSFSIDGKDIYKGIYNEKYSNPAFDFYKNGQWKLFAYTWEEFLHLINVFIGLDCGWKKIKDSSLFGHNVIYINEREEKFLSYKKNKGITTIEKRKFNGELIDNKKMLISKEDLQLAIFDLITTEKIKWK